MMKPILALSATLSLGSSLYLLQRAYFNSKAIFFGKADTLSTRIVNALQGGFSITFAILCISLVLGLFDANYRWMIGNILGILLISLIPGGVVFMGSYWRFFLVGKYRDELYGKLIQNKSQQDNPHRE